MVSFCNAYVANRITSGVTVHSMANNFAPRDTGGEEPLNPLREWLRRNPSISQSKLAAISGVPQPELSRIACGRQLPLTLTQLKLEKATREVTHGKDSIGLYDWADLYLHRADVAATG